MAIYGRGPGIHQCSNSVPTKTSVFSRPIRGHLSSGEPQIRRSIYYLIRHIIQRYCSGFFTGQSTVVPDITFVNWTLFKATLYKRAISRLKKLKQLPLS